MDYRRRFFESHTRGAIRTGGGRWDGSHLDSYPPSAIEKLSVSNDRLEFLAFR